MTVLCALLKNGKTSHFCSLTQSVGFVCSGLITWCCTTPRRYLTVPEEDLVSLLDWHFTGISCHSESSKNRLQSHRVRANYWDKLLRGKEGVREGETILRGLLIFAFTFSLVPSSLSPPRLKHCCNVAVATWLDTYG